MTSKLFSTRHFSKDLALQLLTGTLALVLLVTAGAWVVQKHLWARERLADIEPRYERLLGILESEDGMQQALQRSEQLLQAYTYPADREASQIGTEVQQKLRTAFGGAKINIRSSQVLPEEEDGSLLRVPVEARLEGNLQNLRDALVTLAAQRPVIRIESIRVEAGRKASQHDPIGLTMLARFTVWRQQP